MGVNKKDYKPTSKFSNEFPEKIKGLNNERLCLRNKFIIRIELQGSSINDTVQKFNMKWS